MDPVVKEHESPYATFANNPVWHIDPLGADTFNVVSGSLNSNGGKLKEGQDPLVLFTVYTKDERTTDMNSSDFLQEYQTLTEEGNIEFTVNDVKQSILPYAKFISANKNRALLSKAMHITSTMRLNEIANNAMADVGEELSNYERVTLFYHGMKYDFKDTEASGMILTFIDGVGVYTSDVVGNLIYGNVSARTNVSESRMLSDGDLLQYKLPVSGVSGVKTIDHTDDVFDGYSLMLGYNAGNILNAQNIRANIKFLKTTSIEEKGSVRRGGLGYWAFPGFDMYEQVLYRSQNSYNINNVNIQVNANAKYYDWTRTYKVD